MKYFEKDEDYSSVLNGDRDAIRLEENIFSICVTKENKIKVMEECDGYFKKEFTKEEAIELFTEAIEWIKENAK